MAQPFVKSQTVKNKRTKKQREIVSVSKDGLNVRWDNGLKSGVCSVASMKRWIAGKDK